jgi:CheY-like chemotaxis protein
MPLSEPAAAVSTPAAEPPIAATKVVLYVDDDPVNRLVVQEMLLRCAGVSVALAENGAQGVAMSRERRPSLVLLDLQLPDLNGLEVLGALRAHPATASLPVVLVSANATEADVAAAKALGVLDHWEKPLELAPFVARVTALLSTGEHPA